MANILAGMQPSQAAESAGYGSGDGDTYDCSKAASVLLGKPHIAAAIAQGAVQQAKEAGAISEQWLIDKLVEGIGRPMKSSQVMCLLAACRTIPNFFKDKQASDVTVNVAVVADLAERLAAGQRRLNASRQERGLPPLGEVLEIAEADGGKECSR